MTAANPNESAFLAVSAPPFWHCGRTIKQNNYNILIALIPVVLMAIWHWGIPAARVMAIAITAGIVVEALCQRLMKRDIEVDDFSCVITCLLFSFLLPAASPWWLVIIGATLCIALGKMCFGGLGTNPVNSSLVGWAMLYISWPVLMDPNAAQLNTLLIDPLVRLKYFGLESIPQLSNMDLFLGYQINGLGAGQIAGLLLGGIYLSIRGIIRWEIAISFFVGVLLMASIFNIINPEQYTSPVFHLLTGSTVLCGFFLATESANSPDRPIPMFIYGIIGGIMVIVIRAYGVHTDGAPFAVLIINLLTPIIANIKPKPFGVK